jgi:hypothetical protein
MSPWDSWDKVSWQRQNFSLSVRTGKHTKKAFWRKSSERRGCMVCSAEWMKRRFPVKVVSRMTVLTGKAGNKGEMRDQLKLQD